MWCEKILILILILIRIAESPSFNLPFLSSTITLRPEFRARDTMHLKMLHPRLSSGDEVALRKTYDLCAQGVVSRSFDHRTVR
jgi:hypothetical protein